MLRAEIILSDATLRNGNKIMKKALALLFLTFWGCSDPPKTDDITCPSGHGTCYIVHCDARPREVCQPYFKKLCPKGYEDTVYGIAYPGHEDHAVDCK